MINSKSAAEMRKKAEKATKESFWVEKIISLISENASQGKKSLHYCIPMGDGLSKDEFDKIVHSLKCLGYIVDGSYYKNYVLRHSLDEDFYYQNSLHISW